MFTLLSEIHFWTTQDDISIKDTDYGAFKYYDRKDDCSQSKRNYTEKRKYLYSVTNKRPFKLKDKLKELEELLGQNKIVYYKWSDHNILQLMLCTGIFIYIFINPQTGDAEKITFDRFLIGKLQTNSITDVIKTRSHILCSYNDNRITLIQFIKKPPNYETFPLKLSRLEPRIQTCELAGPSGRRLDRKMSSNQTGDRLLVWWKSTTDEVYPWSPLVKDQDRANIHVYTLYGSKLELQCYKRTEFDPLEIIFDVRQSNLIHCVEQKVSRRGAVSVEVATFEIVRNKLQQNHVTSIPLQTQVSCHCLSPDEANKLALGCIDGSVVLFDRIRGVTNLVKAAFIPTLCSWHSSCSFFFIANERSQIQCFDLSLACVKNQLIAEDPLPTNILDLTSYFKIQPTLSHFVWNTPSHDSLLFLLYERGPCAILRLFDYNGSSVLDASNLVTQYIQHGNIEKALNILLTLDWNTSPEQCLCSLQSILNHLFRCKFTPNIETHIQKALGSFYAPLRPITNASKSEVGDQIADLTRKFFHALIRHQLFEKAFCLAIDIGDHDLFMDLYYVAKCNSSGEEMAAAALQRATELIDKENSLSSSSSSSSSSCSNSCEESSCSQCSSNSPVNQVNHVNQQYTWDNIPPLPNITTTNQSSSSIKPLLVIPPLPSVSIIPKLIPPDTQQNTYNNAYNSNSRMFQTPPVPVIVHKTISLNIPAVNTTSQINHTPLKIINVPLNTHHPSTSSSSNVSGSGNGGGSIGHKLTNERGEKNVKFSDTVTAFIVPELPRTEKPKRSLNTQITNHPFITNPKRELQDSLPLCHPEDEYLKDFTPISNHRDADTTNENDEENAAATSTTTTTTPKIKVVHFGMV